MITEQLQKHKQTSRRCKSTKWRRKMHKNCYKESQIICIKRQMDPLRMKMTTTGLKSQKQMLNNRRGDRSSHCNMRKNLEQVVQRPQTTSVSLIAVVTYWCCVSAWGPLKLEGSGGLCMTLLRGPCSFKGGLVLYLWIYHSYQNEAAD